ncbi:MAG: GNAT family N-acetyltransferase [Luteimonas sp.]
MIRRHDCPEDAPPFAGVRLAGEGLVLRAWHGDDLDALLRHADDAAVAHGLSHRFPHPYTRQDGQRFLTGEVVDLRDPVFAIVIDGSACGGIGARPGVGERRHSAEIGYWLGRRWGCGTMTRVVACYVPWLLQALRLQRLQASVLAGNQASVRVLLKNGFSEEGVLRGAVRKAGELHDLRLFARLAPPGSTPR